MSSIRKKGKKKGKKANAKSNSFLKDLYQKKKGVFQITLLLFVIVSFLLLISQTKIFLAMRQPLVVGFAQVSSLVLNLLGFSTSVDGTLVSSSQFAVDIKEGCDAVAPILLYVATVSVFPSNLMHKLKGLLYGLLALLVMNVIRIITLFVSGIYFPDYFSFLHLQFWATFFIFYALALWIIWYNKIEDAKTTET